MNFKKSKIIKLSLVNRHWQCAFISRSGKDCEKNLVLCAENTFAWSYQQQWKKKHCRKSRDQCEKFFKNVKDKIKIFLCFIIVLIKLLYGKKKKHILDWLLVHDFQIWLSHCNYFQKMFLILYRNWIHIRVSMYFS